MGALCIMVGKFFCFVFLLLVLVSLPVFGSSVSEQSFDNPVILASCSNNVSCVGEWVKDFFVNIQTAITGKPVTGIKRKNASAPVQTEIVGGSSTSKPTVVISNSSSSNQNTVVDSSNEVESSGDVDSSSSNVIISPVLDQDVASVDNISVNNVTPVNNVSVQDDSVAEKLAELRTELKKEKKVLEGYNSFTIKVSSSVLSTQESKVIQLENKLNDLLAANNISTELETQLDEIDSKATTWEANYNSISIKDETYKKSLLGLDISREQEIASENPVQNTIASAGATTATQTLPYYFNWMNYNGQNYITPAKNQSCGACWAFAAIGAFEGAIQAYFNNPSMNLDLSEQDVISCSKPAGCNGGSDTEALEYARVSGVVKESCFPNVGNDASSGAPCSNKCSTTEKWKLTNFNMYYVDNYIYRYGNTDLFYEDIKKEIVTHGPVSAGMYVYEDFFSYSGGIYFKTSDNFQGGHVVTLVGYGYSNGRLYWIGKSSWGTSWGENGGFFRIFADDPSMLNEGTLSSIVTPISPVSTVKLCTDSDSDNFCNWGLGTKPSNCPSSCSANAIEDCDDSNPGVHFNCQRQACLDVIGSATEICDLKDNDCDGWIDNNPGTSDLLKQSCYTGPAGTNGVGVCHSGTQACVNGSLEGSCVGQVLPGTESCNGVDDDCDGTVDDGGNLCPSGQICSSGVCTKTTRVIKANVAVYNEQSGLWQILMSNGQLLSGGFGGGGAKAIPVDFDGDGKADIGVYNEQSGLWNILMTGSGYQLVSGGFGGGGAKAVPVDFDGDGKADIGVYNGSTGLWSILFSGSGYSLVSATFGGAGFVAAPADFDGDGKADPAVYQSSAGKWTIMNSGSGYSVSNYNLGGAGFTPIPADFDADGKADPAVYNGSSGEWKIMMSSSGYSVASAIFGGAGFVAVPADFDADGKADPIVYNEQSGLWQVLLSGSGYQLVSGGFGGGGAKAVPSNYDTAVETKESMFANKGSSNTQLSKSIFGAEHNPEPISCVPDCAGKSCGSDGCGGSCGSCGSNQTCSDNQCVSNPVKYVGYPKNEIMNLGGTYYHVNYAVAATSGEVWCNGSSMASTDGSVDCGAQYGYTCYKASNALVGCVKPCQSSTCNCAPLVGKDLVSLGVQFTDSGVYACGIGSDKRYVGSYASSSECGFFYYWKEIEDCASSGRTCSNGNCA